MKMSQQPQRGPPTSSPLMWGLHHAGEQSRQQRASISSATTGSSSDMWLDQQVATGSSTKVDDRLSASDRQGSSSSLLAKPQEADRFRRDSRSRSPTPAYSSSSDVNARPGAQPHASHHPSATGSWTQFNLQPQHASSSGAPDRQYLHGHAGSSYAGHASPLPNPHSASNSPTTTMYPPARSPSVASVTSPRNPPSQPIAPHMRSHSFRGPAMPDPSAWTPGTPSPQVNVSHAASPPPGQAWHPFAGANMNTYPPIGAHGPYSPPSTNTAPQQHGSFRPDVLPGVAPVGSAGPLISGPTTAQSYPVHQQSRQPGPASDWRSEHRTGRSQSGQAADHDTTTCEGCQADLRAALEASRLSAEADTRRRAAGPAQHERLSSEEMAQINAMELSAAEERAKAEADEAALLQAVMEASLKDEEEAIRSRRVREEQQAQVALTLQQSRDDEAERARLRAEADKELLDRSKREANEERERRAREEADARDIEESVLRQSRIDMEQEWSRRDEEERALTNFLSEGGQAGDAAYWRHLHQDQAYQLAVNMRQETNTPTSTAAPPPLPPLPSGTSGSRHPTMVDAGARRRPLPQIPPVMGPSAGGSTSNALEDATSDAARRQALGDQDERSRDALHDGTNDDPFADDAEAPPMYDEVGNDRPPNAPDAAPSHIRFETHPALLAAAAPARPSNEFAEVPDHWPNEKQSLHCHHNNSAAQSSADGVYDRDSAQVSGPSVRPADLTPTLSSPSSAAVAASRPVEIGSFDEAIQEEDDAEFSPNPLLSVLHQHRRSVSSATSTRSRTAHNRSGSAGSTNLQPPAFRPSKSSSSSAFTLTAMERGGQVHSRPRASSNQSVSSSHSNFTKDGPSEPVRARQMSNASTMTHDATIDSHQTSTSHAPSASTSATSVDEAAARQTPNRGDFSQTTMAGTDWGYALEPFAPELYASPANESAAEGKGRFPNTVQLSMAPADGSGLREGSHRSSFFTIRAPSWKGLLRAMAWYGNTLITAGPQEIADAALATEQQAGSQRSEAGVLSLAVQVEVVTPTRLRDSGYGLGTAVVGSRGQLIPGSVPFATTAAHVAICISLVPTNVAKQSLQGGDLARALKASSRSLDVSYSRRGSARRVIQLPREAPHLPFTMVRLAQHVHAAHRFSAACPTTSSTALHSPRDLHHAIEAHDVEYVRRIMKQMRNANGGTKGKPGSPEYRVIGLDGIPVDPANEAGELRDFAAAEEEDEHGPVGRLAARVRRRLAKRSGDGRVVDDQLMSWVTPLVTEDAVQQEDAWEERK